MKFLKKIDLYILRYYLGTFFFMVLLLALVALVIDFSEKIEDFTGLDSPSINQVIFDYYLNFIPFIISLLFPLCTLITVIFFTARLANTSEIISMIGNGISFYRLLVPYMIGAFVIAGLHYVGNHYIFPISSKARVNFENQYVWKHNYEGTSKNIHMIIGKGQEVYMNYFGRNTDDASQFCLMRYDSTGIYRYATIHAQRAKLVEPDSNLWRLFHYRIRTLDGRKETLTTGKQLDTLINLKKEDLVRRDNLKETMTTAELRAFISRENERGSGVSIPFLVEQHKRTANPFSIFILTLIGVAVSSRKVRNGLGWSLITGVGLGALYIFTQQFSTTFSTNANFPPVLGAWFPNILFSFIALYMIAKAQK